MPNINDLLSINASTKTADTTPSNIPVTKPVAVVDPAKDVKSSSIPSISKTSAVVSPGADQLNTQKSLQADLTKKEAALSSATTDGIIATGPNGEKIGLDYSDMAARSALTSKGYKLSTGNISGLQKYNPAATGSTPAPAPATTTPITTTATTTTSVPGAQPPVGSPESAVLGTTLPDTNSQYYQDYAAAATKAKNAAAGVFTNEEQQQIDQAGAEVSSQYDELISQQKEKASQSKAQNLVAAATSGGLDTSAWVGLASLVGVPAGVQNFEGVGGAVAQLASEWDNSIAQLETEKITAVNAAKEAKKQAIATGDEKSYQIASDMFDKASQIAKDQMTMNMNKTSILQSYQDHLTKTTSEAQAAATTDIQTWASSNIDPSTISDSTKRNMELSLKLPYGTFDQYYNLQKSSAAIKTESDKIDFVQKVITAGKTLTQGTQMTIKMPDGTDYTVSGTQSTATGVKYFTDTNGNITKYNPNTGLTESLGALGKGTTGQFDQAKYDQIISSQPGDAMYKVAQDLAYGSLTLAQFRSLYSYSRDVTSKLAVYDLASKLNPNFNPAQYELGYKVASNVRVRQQISALDNVQARTPDLLQLSDLANRSGVTLMNKIILPAGYQLGGKSYTDFHTAITAYADELSGALGFGSATDMSRQMGFSMTDPDLSPEDFASAIQNVVIPFVQSKRQTLIDQMGVYGPMVNDMSQGQTGATDGAGGSSQPAQDTTLNSIWNS